MPKTRLWQAPCLPRTANACRDTLAECDRLAADFDAQARSADEHAAATARGSVKRVERYRHAVASRLHALSTKPPVLPGEVWRCAPGKAHSHLVSNLGRVWRRPNIESTGICRPGALVGTTGRHGYASVALCGYEGNGQQTVVLVHHIVARAFHGEPPGPIAARLGGWTVDHINGIRNDNRASNLRWMLHGDNLRAMHARRRARRNSPTATRPDA